MMSAFVFPGMTTRVVFGSGTLAATGDELRRLGHDRALILSTPHQADAAQGLAATLGDMAAGVFSGAVMHTPVEVTQAALNAFRDSAATVVIALGGGSTIGLGRECPELCVSVPVHAVLDTQASKRSPNIMAN